MIVATGYLALLFFIERPHGWRSLFVLPRGGPAMARIAAALLVVVWLMVTPLSALVWEATPIARIQFPWRFLVLADIAFALAVLMAAETLTRRDCTGLRRGAAGALLGAFVLIVAAFTHPAVRGTHGIVFPTASSARLSAGALEWLPSETSRTIGSRPFQEIYDMAKPLSAQPPIRLLGPGQVEVVSAQPRRLTFEAELPAPGSVVLRRTFWRFWRLRDADSGREIELEPTTGFPLITAQLPAGRARYVLELPVLMAERLGALISAIALAVLLCWWWLTRRRTG